MVKRVLITSVLAILLLGVFISPSIAQEESGKPDAASIISRMNQALESSMPSVRVMTLKVKSPSGAVVEWKLAQARVETKGSNWMLTVVLLPSSWGEGIALLDEHNPRTKTVEHIYLPAVKRVRVFTPLQAWEPFFGSDFSYQDFSLPRPSPDVELKGTETHDGIKCYRLEQTLAGNPYYSKADIWVAEDTGLPVERDYYDLQGKLYKTERFERTLTIQNVPTITKIVMKDVQQGGSSEIDVTSVKYDKEAPPGLFDPKNLPHAAADQFWKSATQ
jgi:Outer membrane lipoprotein-sorting protein